MKSGEELIYLDNAATTFPKPESVYRSMDIANRTLAVNAGRGSYKAAKLASKVIETTKESLLKLVNAEDNASVVFTPSATIALNQLLQGIIFNDGDIVYMSPYEHNSVARTLYFISKNKRIILKELPINEDTMEIDIDKLKYIFSKDKPKCVCITYVSNVTGYILPVLEILLEAKRNGAITVLDAAQAMGLINIDLHKIKADFMVFAGHKTLYGPFGIAGFIINGEEKLEEFIVGGTGSDSLNLNMPQIIPNKYEPASSNIVAIAGLKSALEWLDVEVIYRHEKELSMYLIQKMSIIKGVKLYLPTNLDNHVGIVSFNFEGYKSSEIGTIFDEDYNIAIRTGYHCAPFIHKYLKNDYYKGTVRIGLGFFTTYKDIDLFCNALNSL